MYNFKKHTLRIIASLLFTFTLIGLLPISAVEEDPFSQWKTENFVITKEDNTPIIKTPSSGDTHVLFLNGKATGNKLSFDIRIDSSYGTVDGNIGAAYKMTNGSQYFFEYNTVLNTVGIRRLGNDGSDNHVGVRKAYTLSLNEWHSMEIEFQSNQLVWRINGEEVHIIDNTGDDPFTDGTLYIQSYFAGMSLKNISVENVYIPIIEKRDYDFEFKTEASALEFKAENGKVSWKNGRLIYTLNGESTLTSPEISAKSGTPYSALLPLRNTILIRMANKTSAKKMRLYFTTTNDPSYSEKKSIVLDVIPNSDDNTYYFNLSACENLTAGYIYGFKLEPIGATSGSIEIEAVSFEREAAIEEKAGKLISCLTDGKNITIKGELEAKYANKTVTLYETSPNNYALTLNDKEKIASVTSENTSFTITIPYENNGMSRLSSLFLLSVEGENGKRVRIGERFYVENGEEYNEGNPYSFKLPEYSVSVLDFGAKGDGFTNDTEAINKAIDHVNSKGGGVVILDGDDSFYGRRYVATCVRLKDNVELRIEKGAILWQSGRAEDYDYDVALGHDIPIEGINWTHTASCHNYPLVYGGEVKNVKVSGGGIIRMQDTGSENYDSVSAGSLWIGCENKIHLVPLGFWKCENVEINNVHLRRTNNYHINFRTCKNVYVHGVTMWEVTCASGDGISATVGTKNITIDQCYFWSNDDAVTICSTYNDPRGLAWWKAQPDGDNCVENVTVRHSYLVGGHGITFITWGTDNPNLEMQEIRNVEVFDCQLGGGTSAVGAWPDNPYFGNANYDNSEKDDYSPVKGVRIHDNQYFGQCTLECIKGTDIITDCGIRSANDFEYGTFERRLRKYKDYVSGLSNWTFIKSDNGDGKAATENDPSSQYNHYGAVYGNGILAQGLYMSKGEHTFTARVKLVNGKASLIVRDVLSGEILAEKKISASDSFAEVSLTFTVNKATTAYLGVSHTGSMDDAVYFDNAKVTNPKFERTEYFKEEFEDKDYLYLDNQGFTLGGTAMTPEGFSGVAKLLTEQVYENFDLHFRLKYNGKASDIDANVGVSLRRSVDGNDQYDIHYDPINHVLIVREYKGGQGTIINQTSNYDLPVGEWVDVAFRFEGNKGLWYINGEKIAEFDIGGVSMGFVGLVAYNTSCEFDDVIVAKVGTTSITGDEVFPVDPPEDDPTDKPSDDEETTTPPEDETTSEEGSTATIEEPTETETNTEANTTATEEKKGCGSSLSLAAASMAALAGIGIAFTKKKEDEE